MSSCSWEFAEGDADQRRLTAVSLLGGGSAYEAYLAFDQHLFAPVVVKVVRPDQIDDASTLSGLERETDMVGALAHPAIVRGFHAVLGGERPHLVLENLDGPRLSRWSAGTGRCPCSSCCRSAWSSPRHCTTCASATWCTSTSSPATSSWARRHGSSTSAWRARVRRPHASRARSAPTPGWRRSSAGRVRAACRVSPATSGVSAPACSSPRPATGRSRTRTALATRTTATPAGRSGRCRPPRCPTGSTPGCARRSRRASPSTRRGGRRRRERGGNAGADAVRAAAAEAGGLQGVDALSR